MNVSEALEETYQRLKRMNEELGLQPQPWGVAMREELFKAMLQIKLVSAVPPCIVLDGDTLPIFFLSRIPVTPIDTEGAKGESNEIHIRQLEELQDGWIPLW